MMAIHININGLSGLFIFGISKPKMMFTGDVLKRYDIASTNFAVQGLTV